MVSQLIKVSPVVIRNKVPTEAGAQEAQVADTRHNYDNDNYKNYDVGWILLSALQHLQREKWQTQVYWVSAQVVVWNICLPRQP